MKNQYDYSWGSNQKGYEIKALSSDDLYAKNHSYSIESIEGKILNIAGHLVMFPTLKELRNSGYGYFEDYRNGEKMIEENNSAIEKALTAEKNRSAREIAERSYFDYRNGYINPASEWRDILGKNNTPTT